MTTDTSGLLTAKKDRAPPKLSIGVVGWVRQNLFNNWYNSLLTIVSLWVVYHVVTSLVSWGLIRAAFGTTPESCQATSGACWSFIAIHWIVFMVGNYPFEERWRTLVAAIIVAVLTLASLHRPLRQHRWFPLAWVLAAVPIFILIRGSETLSLTPVDSTLWGGLMLTVMLSVVGIVVSFPISIVLALGRRSKMPVIRTLSVIYIELIRGVPLITVLFIASVLLPLFFPPGFTLDKVLRAQVGIILFAAAYLAEVVRGGLQAISKGQEEAAMAVGLNYWYTMVFIIMPQALRIVIPPLVSTFIALLKDTSLVTIIGLFDLLAMANATTQDPEWLGKIIEAYVFVAAIYWVICFSMSRYSIRLEARLKAGQL
jgi:general L-amino acid transport system permease protein